MLKDCLGLASGMLLSVGIFLVLPLGEALHEAFDAQRTRTAAPQQGLRLPAQRPAPLSDQALEAALREGLRGRHAAALGDQLRLAYRQRRGLEQAEVWDPVVDALGSQWPVSARWPVTSSFGYRLHPILKRRRFHSGLDLGMPAGTAIRSAQGGVVQRAGYDRVNGYYVVVDHGGALATVYCHASLLLVEEGQLVARGQLLARSGSTGRATGPHLHFGMRIGHTWVDPLLVRKIQVATQDALAQASPDA